MTLRYTFRNEPWLHQRRALAKINKLNGRALLAMPMRTGKTKTTIDWAGVSYVNYGIRRVLVVAPISVLHVWQDEIEAHLPPLIKRRVTLLSGSTEERAETLRQLMATGTDGLDFVIVNYESVWRQLRKPKSKRLDDLLCQWLGDDGLVVADESHKIKTPASHQSRSLAKLGAQGRMRLALTGTPITSKMLDVYGQFRFVDDTILNAPDGRHRSWTEWSHYYGRWGGFNMKELVGYQHQDELLATIHAHTFKVKLEDCFDLPPRSIETIPVHLSEKGRGIYRQMAKEMIVELESGKVSVSTIVLTKLLRLSQITSGFLRTEETPDSPPSDVEIDRSKLDVCMDMVQDMAEQDEKVVIFCRFKHDYHALEAACQKLRLGPVVLSGETPQSARPSLIKRFKTDPATKVFIAQTQAGSLGIDLTAARFSIFYSLSYDWATYAQALERIYGPKQTRPVTIYHLVVPRTVDAVVLQALRTKGDLARLVLHEPRKLLDGMLDAA